MNLDWKKNTAYILVVFALLFIGFLIGRKTIDGETKTETKYVTLPPIHDTITEPYIVETKLQVDTGRIIQECIKNGLYYELFPYKEKIDTIFTSRDTAQIMYDWAATRRYKEILFDADTIGKCEIDVSVQYNRLDTMRYTYIPVQKQTEIKKESTRFMSPFIGVGVSTSVSPSTEIGKHTSVDFEVGMFVNEKYGIGVEYQYEILNGSHNIGGVFYYKF